jgi:hypothetical protein
MILHKDFFLWAFMWIINIIIFFFGWSYAKIMYFDMNLKYIDDKKPKFNKMRFFHVPIIWNYYKMSWIIAGVLLMPIIITIIIFTLFIVWLWGVNDAGVAFTNGEPFLAISSFIIFWLGALSFVYLSYRLYFSYIIFISNYDAEYFDFKSLKCVKESWKITKGIKKLFKLLWILFVLSIMLLPFNLMEEWLNKTYKDVRNYQIFTQVWESDKLKLQESDPYYYGELSIKYGQVTSVDLEKNIQIYYYLIIFFNILLFLLISGLVEMIMVSFYKRVLTHR